MKRFYTLLLGAALVGGTFAASAQDAPEVINRASAFYDLNTFFPKGADNVYFNGFGVGYNVDFRVTDNAPVYVGTGLQFRAVFHSEDIADNAMYDAVDATVNSTFLNLNVPVNVSYRVPVAQNFYLTPYVGLDLRLQVYGKGKVKAVEDSFYGRYNETSYTINYFDKSDMDGDALRRFQLGWHAGVDFEYQRVVLGLSYGTDFVKIHKNLGGSNFLVSVGYRF